MDVKQAVAQARSYLTNVFAEEGVSEVRLEEVQYDRGERAWDITFGILRPSAPSRSDQIAAIMGGGALRRTYKVVRIPEDSHEVPSIKIRELGEE